MSDLDAQGEVRRLATAIRLHAHGDDTGPRRQTVSDTWREFTRTCLDEAGIVLTDDEFTAAWRCMWQSAFHGGSYTQDAARVLKAARALHVAPGPQSTGDTA